MNRRELLRGLALGGIASAGMINAGRAWGLTTEGVTSKRKKKKAEQGFLWGTAGSSYQVEGGNVASDIWLLEHVKPTVFMEPSGDAADTYHRYEEDLAIAASLGLNCHRFSIEWARIEPEKGQFSRAALDYYRRLLEACHKHDLAPVVTMNHFSVPRWHAAAGGFKTQDGIDAFVTYCRTVTEHMGDLIAVAATFNEPNLAGVVRWGGMVEKYRPYIEAMKKAAAVASASDTWSSPMLESGEDHTSAIIKAHTGARDAIREVSGDRIPVGLTLAIPADTAAGPDSGLARKHAEILDPWLAAPGDFIGIQTYTGSKVGPDADLPPEPGTELTQMGYAFTPEALEGAIRIVASKTDKPLYVTENGVATEDDSRRIVYIKGAVSGMQRCMADGIDIRGYMHWSLLDNWEWMSGYRPKFGLVAVDRTTFKRTPKPSAKALGEIARAGGVK